MEHVIYNRDLFSLIIEYLDIPAYRVLRLVSRDVKALTQATVTNLSFRIQDSYIVTPRFAKLFPNVKVIDDLFIAKQDEYDLTLVSKARKLSLGDFIPDRLLPEGTSNLVVCRRWVMYTFTYALIKKPNVIWMSCNVGCNLIGSICDETLDHIHDVSMIVFSGDSLSQIMARITRLRCWISTIEHFNAIYQRSDGHSLEIKCSASLLFSLRAIKVNGLISSYASLTIKVIGNREPQNDASIESLRRFADNYGFKLEVTAKTVNLTRS